MLYAQKNSVPPKTVKRQQCKVNMAIINLRGHQRDLLTGEKAAQKRYK